MTEKEAANLLVTIRAGLPNAFLKLSDADAAAMVALWAEMFREYPGDLVMAAAKTYIWNDTTGRFPSPGAIREHMEAIRRVTDQCAYGQTIREYIGAAADKYPAVVRDYIDHTARARYQERYGRLPPTEMERMARALQQVKGLTEGSVDRGAHDSRAIPSTSAG